MAQIWTRKVLTADPETGQMTFSLIPLNNQEEWEKFKTGEDHLITIKRVRSPKHHRKFFALLNLVFENQEEISDFANFRQVFQMRCGLVDRVVTTKGVLYLPRSISFEKMDQSKFESLYDKATKQAIDQLGCSSQEIAQALAEF